LFTQLNVCWSCVGPFHGFGLHSLVCHLYGFGSCSSTGSLSDLDKVNFCFLWSFSFSCGLHGGGAHCDSGHGDGNCEFFISFFSLWLWLCLFYWFFSWHCFVCLLVLFFGLGSYLSFHPLCVLILVLLLILLMALVFHSYSIGGHICGFGLCSFVDHLHDFSSYLFISSLHALGLGLSTNFICGFDFACLLILFVALVWVHLLVLFVVLVYRCLLILFMALVCFCLMVLFVALLQIHLLVLFVALVCLSLLVMFVALS